MRENESRGVAELCRMAFEHAPLGVAIVDSEYQFREVNSALCALLGYTRDELIEQPVQKVIHPEELQQGLKLAGAILSGSEEPIRRESRLLRKSGEVIRVNVTATTVRDPSGAPRFGLGMIEDITTRKRAERALRRREAAAQAVLEAIPDLHFRVNREGTLLDFYPAENLRTYVPAPKFLGKTIGEVLPLEVANLCLHYVRRAFDTGRTQVFEYDLPDGERLSHYECRLSVCGADELVAAVRDISIRKRTETLLRAVSEGTSATIGHQYFRSLVRHLATMLDVDFAFVCEILDEQWTRVRDISIWTSQGYGEGGERSAIGSPGRDVRGRQRVYHKSGVSRVYPEDRWLADNDIEGYLAVPVSDSSGRALGYTGVAHRGPISDVIPIVPILKIFATRVGAELERRRQEVELARVHEELEFRVEERTGELAEANQRLKAEVAEREKVEEALRRRGKALAASHEALRGLARRLITVQEEERSRLARELHDDLTQHLAALAIEIGEIRRKISAGDETVRRLHELQQEIEKMSSDVHSMSRRLHPWILECLGLADAIESECAGTTESAGIDIRFSHDGLAVALPQDAALCLYRIVQEGLRNLVKHSEAKEAAVDLSVSATDVVLTIRDHGVGFDPDSRSGDPGLGLTAMAERARLCGGDLTIHSAPGAGTLITARLPLPPPGN